MRSTVYKVVFDDDSVFFSNSREDVIGAINKFHEGDDSFKVYNINTINGIIYNNNKKTRGVKSINRYPVKEYYADYLDRYTESLLENAQKLNKEYSHHTISRFKNHFLSFINNIELVGRNNGDSEETIHDRIMSVGLFTF